MTPWTVTNSSELEAAFRSVADGGRIELAPGTYDYTELTGRTFVDGVTITSAVADDRAVFTDRLLLKDVGGVTIAALEVEAAALAPGRNYPRLTVRDSADVTIADVSIAGHIASADEGQDPFSARTKRLDPIAGFGQDIGLTLRNSTDVTLTGLELSDLRMGIGLSDADDISIRNVDIHHVREGINMHDVRGVLIEDNQFRNFTPWSSGSKKNIDHPDMIQFYGANSTFGVHDLTIRNNVFHQDADDLQTQTIFGRRNTGPDPDIALTNFAIIGNTIINGHLHGISIYDVDGVRIIDNVLLPKPDLDDIPSQVNRPAIVTVRSSDIEISGNTLLPFSKLRDMKIDYSTDVTVADDNIILSYTPGDPLFWRTVLEQVEAGTWDHGGADRDDTALDIGPDVRPGDVSDDVSDDGAGGRDAGDGSDQGADDGAGGVSDDGTDHGTGGGSDDPAAVIKAAQDAGWRVKTATPADDILRSGDGPTVLVGGSENDWLSARGQDTIMFGGADGDGFVFDFRNTDNAVRHVVTDLDWDAGDYLRILTPDGGHFVRSPDKLAALVDRGWLSAAAHDDGTGTRLHVTGRPDQQIDLGVAPDLLDWIG